jgi:hypothetical protein
MHLFQGHRTSSEPLWHVGLPPLFTQAYIHSLHRFLAHFMICDDYFMISSGFPFSLRMWVGLGKQTGLSRPNDAALCEAVVAAQAPAKNVDDQRGCQR